MVNGQIYPICVWTNAIRSTGKRAQETFPLGLTIKNTQIKQVTKSTLRIDQLLMGRANSQQQWRHPAISHAVSNDALAFLSHSDKPL